VDLSNHKPDGGAALRNDTAEIVCDIRTHAERRNKNGDSLYISENWSNGKDFRRSTMAQMSDWHRFSRFALRQASRNLSAAEYRQIMINHAAVSSRLEAGHRQSVNMQKLRYFAASKSDKVGTPTKAAHTEFLRTGRISRHRDDWVPEQKRYLTYEEVAERTGKRLEAAADTTHTRINSFHRSIQFPKIIFHRTLADSPHLGYCHVTAARTTFAQYADVRWAFYIANFFAEIGDNEVFFERIKQNYSRMYFAVALKPEAETKAMAIDRSFRDNGLLFRTHDPKQALRNVLMLGARDAELRKIIAKL
jgi:hypothetical protein